MMFFVAETRNHRSKPNFASAFSSCTFSATNNNFFNGDIALAVSLFVLSLCVVMTVIFSLKAVAVIISVIIISVVIRIIIHQKHIESKVRSVSAY